MLLTHAPGEPKTVYVVEQPGRVIRLRGGRRTVFLDIRDEVAFGGEQGLLGLAFDPGYARNRRFYVAYTSDSGRNTVVRYRSNGAGAVTSSRTILLAVPDPYGNHNGGHLAFGPDGLLYTSIGDGGSGGDPEDRSQNMRSQFGKLLTLDPTTTRGGLVDRRARPPEPVALLVRPRDRRPLHRRRRPGRDRGDQLHAAVEPGPRELRLEPVRGLAALRGGQRGGGQARVPGGRVRPRPRMQRHRRLRLSRQRPTRRSVAATSTATTAAGSCGASASPAARRRDLRVEPFRVESLTSFGENAAGELFAVSGEGTIYRIS